MSRKKDENDEIRRLKINERERRRMHDLNSAMDGLRSVMPYARGNFQFHIFSKSKAKIRPIWGSKNQHNFSLHSFLPWTKLLISGPNVRKLSKIASILLARNYILQLQMQIEELKQAVIEEQHKNETCKFFSEIINSAEVLIFSEISIIFPSTIKISTVFMN